MKLIYYNINIYATPRLHLENNIPNTTRMKTTGTSLEHNKQLHK